MPPNFTFCPTPYYKDTEISFTEILTSFLLFYVTYNFKGVVPPDTLLPPSQQVLDPHMNVTY